MSADEYLEAILDREAVDTGPTSPVRGVQRILESILREWAGSLLIKVHPSGSFAKGTANRSGTDIDLFISLSERTNETLKNIYESLFRKMTEKGYSPRRQNVSIKIKVDGYNVDLVPAKRHDSYSDDHSLYRRRADTWTKTNVVKHISYVIACGRLRESRVIKLWREQKVIDFPSFYLELTVIDALSGQPTWNLSENVMKVFAYLRDIFPTARVVDPANTNNVISDDLSSTERAKVKAGAEVALRATNWFQIVV